MQLTVDVGVKICHKFIPKCSRTSPCFTGEMLDAFWNVMDSEDYNFYNVWTWEMCRWEYKEEVTTTWPRQEHDRPNELKLHT